MRVEQPVFVAGDDELAEERVRLEGLGLELGVELAAEEVGVAGDFDDLDVGLVGSGAAEAQAAAGEQGFVLAVELVAVAVALADFGCAAVGAGGERVFLEDAGPGAQTHGAAHLFDAEQLAQLVDDAVLAGGVELAGVGVFEAADVAGELDAGGLHAEADAEVGDLLFAGVADGVQHALDAALAEAAGDEDAVEAFELRLVAAVVGSLRLQAFGFDPGDLELEVLGDCAVGERFLE